MAKTAPYGTWISPITADTVVGKDNIVFDDVLVDPVTHEIYHLEESPSDGRCIVMETPDNPVLPTQYSARTLVQEYGGAPAIVHNDTLYFSNQSDNRIYTLQIGKTEATAVTPDDNLLRYANFELHPTQTNLLVTLREDHTDDPDGQNPGKVVNTICVVDTQANAPNGKVIIKGAGFYATPVFSPSGDKIAWQQWDLPDMPWQGGMIYVADVVVQSGSITVSQDSAVLVAGANGTVSATFPRWITNTTLVYVSDCGENKFMSPYIYDTKAQTSTAVLKTPKEQDFAEPAWNLGLYPYAILGGGKYGVFTAFENGANILYLIDLTAPSDPVPIPQWEFTVAQHVRAVDDNTFVFTGSRAIAPGGVVRGTVGADMSSVSLDVLKYSANKDSPLLKYVSKPNPTPLTASDGHTIYIVRYDPFNPDYSGSSIAGEKPPCIVHVHGGPTGLEPQALNWIKMFYTSRGFVWLDVNYRGSSGYGRVYSDLLNGHWGRYDVEDCYEAAVAEAKNGYIDGKRVAIRGGSAGAYTTLSSVTFTPAPILTYYKSACGAYGCVCDVETLTAVSEKFEMNYIWTLFGMPPDGHAWKDWNPINFAANIQVPLLALQGLADGVVHPSMLRDFLSKSTNAGPDGGYAFYPGEGHHWHKESTIRNALGREHHWYMDTLL